MNCIFYNKVSFELYTEQFNTKNINNLYKIAGLSPRVGYTKFSKLIKSLEVFPWSWTEDMLYEQCMEWCLEHGLEIVSETICDNGTVIIDVEDNPEVDSKGNTWNVQIRIEAKGSPGTRRKAISNIEISFIVPEKGYRRTDKCHAYILEARWINDSERVCTLKVREATLS